MVAHICAVENCERMGKCTEMIEEVNYQLDMFSQPLKNLLILKPIDGEIVEFL